MIGATNHSLVLQYLDPLALGFRIQHHGSKVKKKTSIDTWWPLFLTPFLYIKYKVKVLNQTQHAYSQYMKAKTNQEQAKVVSSPMPGRIISVSVKEGDDVIEGSELVVVEAMKMQNILRTPHLGKIKKIFIEPGNTVQSGQLLIEFEDVK